MENKDTGSTESTHVKPKKRGMEVKVYLVFQRTNIPDSKQAHEKLIGARLTHEAAEKLVGSNCGCYIHKTIATK